MRREYSPSVDTDAAGVSTPTRAEPAMAAVVVLRIQHTAPPSTPASSA